MLRIFLRIMGGFLGVAAGLTAVVTVVLAYVNVAAESGWRKEHPGSFWGGFGYCLAVLVVVAILSGMAYAFLRYALRGPQRN
jgi:uncharacterized membrane protein